MIEKVIKNVLELNGVDGACILDKRGAILHNALPSYFIADFLDDLSRRIFSMYEAVDENYLPCDDYLLKFPQKFIQIRRSRTVLLLVIVDPGVNLVSLRMVTNIVLKHITPKVVGELRATAAKEVAPATLPPPDPPRAVTLPASAPATPAKVILPKVSGEEQKELEPVEAGAVSSTSAPAPKKRFYRGVEY